MAAPIYLIRHGETQWTLTGQHTSHTDVPLTERGEQQARHLGTLLQGLAFDQVLVSPLQRARRTCELAGLGAAARVEPNLREWDYGDYEGLSLWNAVSNEAFELVPRRLSSEAPGNS